MRRYVTTLSLAAAMLAGTSLAASEGKESEARFNAKYGRSTPAEEKRQAAQAANTAYRDVQPRRPSEAELRYRQKFGRWSPAEQARIDAENANTAYRQDERSPKIDWTREYQKRKLGR